MDVLSSQANIAGYKAVLLAANEYGRFMPMLMTAAGTVKAARVLVLGAGVAGLQAIATAKRLGAVVEAFDVRPAVKEQVESLGAKFVEVPGLRRRAEAGRNRGRLRARDERGVPGAPGRACRRARPRRRYRHHDRVDTRPPGASAAARGNGQGDEARLGDRRPRRGTRRQLPADPARPHRDGPRRQADRALKPAGAAGGRCERALRAQPPELRESPHRPQDLASSGSIATTTSSRRRWCASTRGR